MTTKYYIQIDEYMTPVSVELTRDESATVARVLKEILKESPYSLIQMEDDETGELLVDNYESWWTYQKEKLKAKKEGE